MHINRNLCVYMPVKCTKLSTSEKKQKQTETTDMTFKEYVFSFSAGLIVTAVACYATLCFMEYVARICVNS